MTPDTWQVKVPYTIIDDHFDFMKQTQEMWKRKLLAVFLTLAMSSAVAVVEAMAAENDLLVSYIGSWQGAGALIGGEEPEPLRCRLNISKGNETKINYAGRCSLVSMNLSVSGTIAFDVASQHFMAVMSSNAGFTGTAIGRRQDGKISFDLSEKQVDRGGNDVQIGARITLIADSITVDFEVEFNNSGQILTASVPFQK